MGSTILRIGDILVSSEIITCRFCCDYASCRGACCIIGESGAPLLEEECGKLESAYPGFAPLMSEEGRRKIAATGFFEVDCDGDLVTPLLGNGEECAYTRMENSNCLCSIELAAGKGLCKFVKPISCRLYPIRVSTLSNGMKALNLHRWDICAKAFEKGEREGMPVYEFLRKPLIEAFGEEFYEALRCAGSELEGQRHHD